MRRTVTILLGAGVLLGGVLGSLAPGAIAAARPTTATIKPNQTFVGLVNGSPTTATIEVACPEAVRPGEKGHPVGGQTIGVRSPATSASSSGATGTRGRSIVARFFTSSPVAPSTASASVTFTDYGSEPFPATVLLPCLGPGTLVFSARPTSATARSETMTVTYTTPCPGICADTRH